jgi:hypothetical protein
MAEKVSRPSRWRPRMSLFAALALSAVALLVLPGFAAACITQESAARLPGGTWTAGNGKFTPGLYQINGRAATSSTVCVGPITYNGTYQAPYGWGCHPTSTEFGFPQIYAASGFYNPNPGTEENLSWIGYGAC